MRPTQAPRQATTAACDSNDPVECRPPHLAVPAARTGTERTRVHRQRQSIAVADRQDQQAEQQARVPAAAKPADPTCLAQRGQVLAEPRDAPGRRRGPRRRTGPDTWRLLDERVDQARRIGREREDRADRRDGDDPRAQRQPGGQRRLGDPERADREGW